MNKHSVKFVRGSKTIWDQLNTTPEKIDNNTLYFIYEDENYSVGKLYLGQRLITDDKIINIKDIGDIQIDDESLIDKQILIYDEEDQKWKNSSLEEIIDLSNYYTKDEINNVYRKTIVSANRPPSGAPAELDVDLLRVGDTWILSGENIVYKLVEAQYNYQPVPSAEPYHRFIWQPLNERHGVGNTEPPTSVTYQAVTYTINEVQWSWLPVPEYLNGDHYQMQIGVDDPTYYICKSASMPSTGVCTYTWREESGSVDAYTKAETNALLADKMDLAPLNPTAEQIASMPSGQLYGDTANHKGVIKDGQEFYDTEYINSHYYDKNRMRLIYNGMTVSSNIPPTTAPQDVYSLNHLWLCYPDNTLFRLTDISYDSSTTVFLTWQRANNRIVTSTSTAPERTENNVDYKYCAGDIWVQYDSVTNKFLNLFVCVGNQSHGVDYKTWYFSYTWVDMFQNTYTKTEIDSMIGDIETALSEV